MFEGQFKLGLVHGKGVFTYENGDIFKGEFVNGKREGYGECSWSDGSFYFGYW